MSLYRTLACALCLLGVGAGSVFAQEAPAAAASETAASAVEAPQAAEAGPDGRALLDASVAFIAAQPALAVEAEIQSELTTKDGPSKSEMSLSVLLAGEKNARLRIVSPTDEAAIYSDGESRYIHLVPQKQYLKAAAAPERRELFNVAGSGAIRVASSWLGEYLHAFEQVTTALQSATYVGKAKPTEAASEEAHHVKLAYAGYDIDLYLAAGEQPVPVRYVMDFTKALQAQPGSISSLKITADLSGWNFAPEIDASTFAWQPTEDLAEYAPPARTAPGERPTLGGVAPAFALKQLGGEEISLAQHKDKDIVILDFFASWCGPCRMAMPVVHEVAEQFKDKNVQLYAVNVREPEPKVNAFLESAKLQGMDVLLDPSGAVGSDYGAMSIPRLVVVGKDGTVQAIHSGFSPALKETLTAQLEQLIAGQRLAAPPA